MIVTRFYIGSYLSRSCDWLYIYSHVRVLFSHYSVNRLSCLFLVTQASVHKEKEKRINRISRNARGRR
jgi:hypothetical protein